MPLDAAAARSVYDRIGSLQDSQRFYEDRPVDRMVELSEMARSEAVFELGCGTGRLARKLLGSVLPTSATYFGVDVSPKMVETARGRLDPWAPRARVEVLEPPATELPARTSSTDRFVATYVFDLLHEPDSRALLAEASRVLAPGGRLALVSLTHGTTTTSRIVANTWARIAERRPRLVGGCRPVRLQELVREPTWRVQHREVVVALGVPSEILVAELA